MTKDRLEGTSSDADPRETELGRSLDWKRPVQLGSALLALQAIFATAAGANTLAITRVEAIRDKMVALNSESAQPAKPKADALVRQAQWFSNWGNWPGWLPKKAQMWRWPRG